MTSFSAKDISELTHLYKINLINSCSGFKSANLIGSISSEGITNVAIFSSVVHLGSNPPTLGFILRPTTVPRNTYKNIKSMGVFTINHIAESFMEEAHHTSAKYDEEISEFDVTNLEEEYKQDFIVPFVKNAPVQLAMKYKEDVFIKSNNVLMIVAEIETIHLHKNLLEKDGFINLSKGNIIAINGLDGYTVPSLKTRFPYQRPKN
jgi:flavin reductase (DIM6/NTAB) family NADH-FMN oxidoreductase RutF